MKPLTVNDVRRATGARLLTLPPQGEAPQFTSVCTDSRAVSPGCLFVAIPGERFDGHDFVSAAAAAGALAAVVEHPVADPPNGFMLLKVESTRTALGKLGRHVRQTLRGKVIAVAGSNGKTGTKHLIDAALSHALRGSVSPKSFNNDIGVPATIFAADPTHDYLVLEMGTNHPGEIRTLTGIGLPDIAVITNCGPEHLEFLGDLSGVRRENASIVEGLNRNGLLVVNGDDPELLHAVEQYPGKRITFGFDRSNDLFAADVEMSDLGVSFRLNGSRQQQYFVPLLGRHNACNALAAIAVARRLGLAENDVREALAHARGPDMRLQLVELGGIRILNDAYNANPASMLAAIETFCALPAPAGRRVMVLGDMLELGATSDHHHREIGQAAARARPDALVCVGERARVLAESAGRAGLPVASIQWHPDSTAAADDLAGWVRPGDLLLLKGSRGVRLERILDALSKRSAA